MQITGVGTASQHEVALCPESHPLFWRIGFMQISGIATALVLLLTTLGGCQPDVNQNATSPESADALDRGIEAHGGISTWNQYRSLSFDLVRGEAMEHHVVDLRSRQVRVEAGEYTIGYDGNNVWITPGMDSYNGSPRFYSSLFFYFFSTPFVLADPGTHREVMGNREVNGNNYDVVRISFDDGIGDSPKDYYLPHFNQDTGRMDLLLYTATFRSQEVSTRYNAQMYEEWQEVDGLLVPAVVTSYQWDNDADSLGAQRSSVRFANVAFDKTPPDPTLFKAPEGAEFDGQQPES